MHSEYTIFDEWDELFEFCQNNGRATVIYLLLYHDKITASKVIWKSGNLFYIYGLKNTVADKEENLSNDS